MIELLPFESLNSIQKKMVLDWRNDKRVSFWMYNQDSISLKNHLSFIDRLKDDDTKRYFLVKKDELDLGVIDLCEIKIDSAHGGLYQNPELKGYGKVLLSELVKFAFNELKIKKLFLEAYENNKRALKLYKKMGFVEVKNATFNSKKLISLELINENI